MDSFGTDALRFTLLTGSTPGNDMNLSLDRVRANRNFANKIWNAARFIAMNLGQLAEGENSEFRIQNSEFRTLADRWIESRLNHTVSEVTRLFDAYQFGEAGRQAYDFLWGDFADWYIEIAKLQLRQPDLAWSTAWQLVRVLDQTLRLLHPFIPYVTEEIWQNLKRAAQASGQDIGPAGGWPDALIIAPWPTAARPDDGALAAFERIQEIIRAIRNARAEYDVKPGRRIAALVSAGEHLPLIEEELPVIARLAQLDSQRIQLAESLDAPDKAVTLVAGGVTISLPLAGLVDLEAELARLGKELANAEKQVKSNAGKLNNPGFVNNAPAQVVEATRQRLAEWQNKQAQIRERLDTLQA